LPQEIEWYQEYEYQMHVISEGIHSHYGVERVAEMAQKPHALIVLAKVKSAITSVEEREIRYGEEFCEEDHSQKYDYDIRYVFYFHDSSGVLAAFLAIPNVVGHPIAIRSSLQSYILVALAFVAFRYVVSAHLEVKGLISVLCCKVHNTIPESRFLENESMSYSCSYGMICILALLMIF